MSIAGGVSPARLREVVVMRLEQAQLGFYENAMNAEAARRLDDQASATQLDKVLTSYQHQIDICRSEIAALDAKRTE